MWMGPFLLVPVLLVGSLVIETRLQESGFAEYIPVGKRSDYSVWRVAMLTCMVGAPLSALFLYGSWQAGDGGHGFTGRFFASFLTLFIVVYLITVAASFALLPPLTVPLGFIASRVFIRAAITAFWGVSAAFLCSSITSGSGAAVLSLGLFSLGLFPGLAGGSMGWWVLAPLGDMVRGVSGAEVVTLVHSLVYMLFSMLILSRTTR